MSATDPTTSSAPDVDGDVIDASTVIVCCGSGGVGKTTTAAVLGLEAARRGRRAVVVTIDPARRLADALGLEGGLASHPQQIDFEQAGQDAQDEPADEGDEAEPAGEGAPAAGPDDEGEPTDDEVEPDNDGEPAGELWAMMLDTAATFDGLVRRHAESDEQIERILTNSFYRNIAGALSGTQEYMAAETLHDLHGDDRFDLVIVDTPPSRNALDFLEAPGVLARFLDHRLFRLLMLPTRGGLKVIGTATQPILKAIGRVVGSDVLADSVAFFQAFAGMETGFRERAGDVMRLIRAPGTSFVIVAAPRHDTIDEAVWFANQLIDQGVGVTSVIVNRTHPEFGEGTAADAAASAIDARSDGDEMLGVLWDNVADLRTMRDLELAVIAPLVDIVGVDRLVVLPLLDGDVHDLDGLMVIAGHLFDHPAVDG